MSVQASNDRRAQGAAPTPPPPGRTPADRPAARWRSLLRTREAALALLILVATGLLALTEPKALNVSNLLSVGTGMIYDLPVAAGMTLVMILGGIDLSVGAVLGLSGVVTALACARAWRSRLRSSSGSARPRLPARSTACSSRASGWRRSS
jgi:ribose transport system permease protein